jgi:hypothetical protein
MNEEILPKVFFILLAVTLILALAGTLHLEGRKLDILEAQGCPVVTEFKL